jgi:hypothetical protein
MMGSGRKLCSLAAALAVLVVSVTCSSAGCLLPLVSSQQQQPGRSCCRHEQHDQAPSNPTDRCPLCQNSILINNSVEKSSTVLQPHVLCPLYLAADLHPIAILPQSPVAAGVLDASPPAQPATLLGLHCALLN